MDRTDETLDVRAGDSRVDRVVPNRIEAGAGPARREFPAPGRKFRKIVVFRVRWDAVFLAHADFHAGRRSAAATFADAPTLPMVTTPEKIEMFQDIKKGL